MGILAGVLGIAVITDWRCYRIPNLCILGGMAAGLVMTYMSYSVTGVLEALADMLLIFLAFYPFYLSGGIGAGDVKLFMTIGCYIRGGALLRYMLVTMAVAAVLCIGKMVLFRESRERLFYLGRYLRKAALTGVVEEYEVDRSQKRSVVRLTIPALASLLLLCAGVY